MGKPFKGVINVDIADSVPDWEPYTQPMAPEGAPNVVYIVLDDVGFSAMGCYGGPIETPNMDRLAAEAADEALAALRAHPLGADAVLLGEVRAEPAGLVLLDTTLGGTRIVDMLVGDPLPRIC